MATRFEIIAKALPLHAQTIAERTFTCQKYYDGQVMLDELMGEATFDSTAPRILGAAFLWELSPEGFNYWCDLHERCRSSHSA